MFHQRSDNLCMSEKRRERQRGEFVVTHDVRVRASLQQHAHNSQASMLRRAHQGRDAMRVARVDILHARQHRHEFIDIAGFRRTPESLRRSVGY